MFKIDTAKVADASSQVKKAAQTLESCLSSVQGYNVNCDGEDFPFDAAKSSIVNSIQICQEKLKNTADSLEKVASIHEELQNTLAKGDYEEKPPEQASGDNSSSGSYSSGSYSSGGSSGGGHSSGRHSSSSSSGTSASTGVAAIPSAVAIPTTTTTTSTDDDIDADLSQLPEDGTSTDTGYIYIPASVGITTVPTEYTDEQKLIFEDTNLITDTDGYLKLDNKYIISCNSSIGKVGDVVTITTKTGANVECIIGSVSDSTGINMYINSSGTVNINNSVTSGFTNNIQSITNTTASTVEVNQPTGTTVTVDTNSTEVSAAGAVSGGSVSPITSTTTDDLNNDNVNDAIDDNSDGSEQ